MRLRSGKSRHLPQTKYPSSLTGSTETGDRRMKVEMEKEPWRRYENDVKGGEGGWEERTLFIGVSECIPSAQKNANNILACIARSCEECFSKVFTFTHPHRWICHTKLRNYELDYFFFSFSFHHHREIRVYLLFIFFLVAVNFDVRVAPWR